MGIIFPITETKVGEFQKEQHALQFEVLLRRHTHKT